MNKQTRKSPILIAGTTAALLLTLLSGCASVDDSRYQVRLDASAARAESLIDRGNAVGADGNAAAGLEPYLSYGNDGRLGRPMKMDYNANQGEYSLDFVGVALNEFIAIVFNDLLGENYVFDKSLKGEVTVQTRGKVNDQQLLSIVESVLAMHSAVMVKRDGRYEILPLSKAKSVALTPELFNARKLKPGYRMVVIPVHYINPDDLKPILDTVASSAGHLKIDKNRRAIVVSGSNEIVTSVADIVRIFDVDWLSQKSLGILPVIHVKAADLKKEILKILDSQNKNHGVVLDTIDRFNALLVVAGKRKELEAVRKWMTLLDKPVPRSGAQLHVYKVQNRKSSELAEMLNNIFTDVQGSSLGKKKESKVASDQVKVVSSNDSATVAPTTASAKPLKVSEIRIVADESNNSILILSSQSQYENILSVVKDLDTLPLQVLIEVSIVEVTLTDELSYGLEWYLRHNGIADKFDSDTTLDLNSGAGIGPIAPGFSFLLSGTGALVRAVFNTLAAESKLNVISSPSLMALDNHTATIRVGDQQPVQVSSTKSTNNDVLTQSIEYKNTGVLLSVTPRVNSGGLVTMELSQEVTDVGGIDDATGQRSFLQRNINSTVAVQDGRTIILGGLITENSVNAGSGIPGAYKWPVIGGLFGKKSRSKVKRELIVLITPKVIYNHQYALDATREYAEKMQLLKSSLILE